MIRLWLRWSWRDLRGRWVQVAVIALIIALGTGSYAAFNSMTRWRQLSNDASFAVTRVHDLRARLGSGALLPAGALVDAARSIASAGAIADAEERLIVPTQVDVRAATGDVLVRGRMVGVDVSAGGPHVTLPWPEVGRALSEADAGEDVVVIEHNFARHYALPDSGEIRVGGDRALRYVGQALAPEYFIVMTEEGGMLAEANFAVVFTSLETAGRLVDAPGMVNDLVLRLAAGADREAVQRELAERLAPLGATVMTIDDDASYNTVVRDVEGDQQTTTVLTVAILAGAVFAAFNLTTRMVEAQRREIGVAMALGVPPWRIAARPLLVGIQIAMLGALFGVAAGYVMGLGVGALLRDVMPTPSTSTPFQFDVFLRAAAIGVVAPLIAITYPVWRAVRVAPVQAIRTGHLAARGWGLTTLLRHLPVPGGSLARMPLRNLLRAPRRSVLTALGIAAAIAVLVAVLGALDAFLDADARNARHFERDHPERVTVQLDGVYPLDADVVSSVTGASTLRAAEPVTRIGGTLLGADEEIDVFVDFVSFASETWTPLLLDGSAPAPGAAGIVIAEKAGDDLGVGAGDTVRLRHAARTATGFSVVVTEIPVLGFHAGSFRTFAYLDRSQLAIAGLEGTATQVTALPADGADETAVKRALFSVPGVASVESASGLAGALGDVLEEFASFFYILVAVAMLLAGLIAFNSTSIAADERRREHATMFAFGVPVRTVLLGSMVEAMLLGVVATAAGVAGGLAFLEWLVSTIMARTAPDIGARAFLSPQTLATGIVLGIGAVTLAPVFTLRRLRRMDVPGTLRVME